MNLRAGSLIDARYELVERLGQGGQGSVWKAFDRSTGEPRALKIVDLPEGDDETTQRAHREARLVCGLDHPSLVHCHSVAEIPHERFLVLVFDLVTATPLAEARSDARLGRVHWLAALRHIAGALAHLHRRGVVHRDLKPDNILVTPLFWEDPAAPGSLKRIDFGIAAPRRGPEGATLSGRFGTPPYMAPELFASPGLEDQRSPARDVFAFGVIAWDLLEGSHPAGLPRGSSMSAFAASYQALRSGRSPWPPHAPQGAWGSVISACLALDPAARPADGAAILAMLGDPSQAPRAPDVAERRSRPSRSPDLAGPTDSHAAPRGVSVPEPTVPSAPSKGALSTERAVASSLPRPSAVERTTPMPPEVVVTPPPAATPEPRKPPKPHSEGPSQKLAAPAPERTGAWPWILVALVTAAVAALCLVGIRFVNTSPTTVTSSRADALTVAPTASAAPTLPPPTAYARDASAPDGSVSDSAVPPPPIRVCCGSRPGCSSNRSCSKECDEHLPELDFALRVVGLTDSDNGPDGDEDTYPDATDDKPLPRDIAKHHPDAEVCFWTGADKENKGCAPMRQIAAKKGAVLEKPKVSASHFTTGSVRFRIIDKKTGFDSGDRTIRKRNSMNTSGLCTGWQLPDTEKRITVSFYLEDR